MSPLRSLWHLNVSMRMRHLAVASAYLSTVIFTVRKSIYRIDCYSPHATLGVSTPLVLVLHVCGGKYGAALRCCVHWKLFQFLFSIVIVVGVVRVVDVARYGALVRKQRNIDGKLNCRNYLMSLFGEICRTICDI